MKLLLVFLFAGYCSAGHLGYTYVSPAVSHAVYTPAVAHQPVQYHAVVPAVKTELKAPIPILRYAFDRQGDGSFNYGYESGNGIQIQEFGKLKNAGTDAQANSVEGSYSFTAEDGKVYTVSYVADENGFRATGDHLPQPPPIPEAIQRSLESNAAEEAALAAAGRPTQGWN